jgi:hypothetical protein
MFADALAITGQAATLSNSNLGATKEPGEPAHAGNAGGKSLWWSWTTPAEGTVTLDTVGSSFDTLLAVYTGEAASNLVSVAASDDMPWYTVTSRLDFFATLGTVYRICVDGCGGDQGTIVLNLWLGPLPPQITGQPQSQAAIIGAAVQFTVTATGATPLSYQWFKDGGAIPDATGTDYTIGSAQTSDNGTYSVVVSNAVGRATSSDAVLTVKPIVIVTQPQGLTVAAGYPARFQVAAKSTKPLSYQWQKDGTPINGETAYYCLISSAEYRDACRYTVVLSNDTGTVTSDEALLQVITPYTFTTLAGVPGNVGTNDGAGSVAQFSDPHGIAVDKAGNVYVTEIGNYSIRKITPDGVVSTLARLGPISTSWNPFGGGPWDVAVDEAGNLFVTDTPKHTILRMSPDGAVTTIAGLAGVAGRTDGTNGTALFNTPSGLAVDRAGVLYLADWENNQIRKINQDGVVTTLAGDGTSGYRDGRWTKAQFYLPVGIALDGAGNVYVADEGNNTIRKVSMDGVVTTLAGGGSWRNLDGTGSAARFSAPHGGAVDHAGNIYVADMDGNRIRRITPDGVVATLAGDFSGLSGSVDGPGAEARFSEPRDVAVDAVGNIYVADLGNNTVRKGAPFAITTWPLSQTAVAGTEVTLSAQAAGTGPFSYLWLLGGAAMPGQTNATLALGPVSRANGGLYSVVVSNAAGNWLTLNCTLRVLVPLVFRTPEVRGDGAIQLLFQSSDGGLPDDLSQVTAQRRTLLPGWNDTNWDSITSGFSVTDGWVVVNDTNALSGPSGFYRALAR